MAINVMSWAWRESAADGADLLVLLAIADQAHEDGDGAWPSVATLAGRARVSERTVQRCIRHLVELGELEVQAGAGRHGVNVYRVLMERQRVTPSQSHPVTVTPVKMSPRTDDGVTSETEGVTSTAPRGDTGVTQTVRDPSKEPSIEPSSSSTASPTTRVNDDEPTEDVRRLCDLLADLIAANDDSHKRPNVGKTWFRDMRLLIDVDERTPEKVEKAIRWSQQDAFWRSNILSPRKLRSQYRQLQLKAQTANASATKAQTADDWAGLS